jgi:hypothetical protein
MWRNVVPVLYGLACVLGGILHLRNPERLAKNWWFRHLTIAGAFLSYSGLLLWVRIIGAVMIVFGVILLAAGVQWLTSL